MSTYDVELERTDEQPKSRYLTKRDAIRLVVGLIVLLILLYPVYMILMGNAQNHLCESNLNQMFHGVDLYATENNDCLPPVYVTAENEAPLIENGSAYTWVSLIDGYVKDRTVFTCPAADLNAGEGVRVHTSDGGSLILTYGMVAPLGGEPRDQIDSPERTLLLAETSNYGSQNTFDPFPFKDGSGKVVPFDGFIIGYDDSNLLPTNASRFMTRLSFYNSKDGTFDVKKPMRHRDAINALTVSGSLRRIKATQADYKNADGAFNPDWLLPKSRRFR